jgi:hypothetical protein
MSGNFQQRAPQPPALFRGEPSFAEPFVDILKALVEELFLARIVGMPSDHPDRVLEALEFVRHGVSRRCKGSSVPVEPGNSFRPES